MALKRLQGWLCSCRSQPTDGSRPQLTSSISMETISEDRTMSAYKVVVRGKKNEWFVFRCYEEFHVLHSIIVKEYPQAKLELPARNQFVEKLTMDEATHSLDMFVQQLLASGILIQTIHVREFLQLHREGKTNSDTDSFFTQSSTSTNSINTNTIKSNNINNKTNGNINYSNNSKNNNTNNLNMNNNSNNKSNSNSNDNSNSNSINNNTSDNINNNNSNSNKNSNSNSMPAKDVSSSKESLLLVNLGPSENKQVKPDDFEFLRVIGKGSFGKVLLARRRDEMKYYAIKVLSKKQVLKRDEAKHIMSERNVLLKNLDSPFLVGLHYSFQTPDKLYFVLDYVNGGELFFHLQRERYFQEPRARFYAAEMSAALGHLHSHGIIYRDLKPENLLLDSEGHIVLTDFGLSKEGLRDNEQTHTFCGTPEYLAPEVLKKEGYDNTVDWWCLGAVLFEMLYGLPPFYSRNTSEMYDRILNKPVFLKPSVSEEARDILTKLLHKDRLKRLGAGKTGFQDIKLHAFFRPLNWEDLLARRIKPPFNPNVTDAMDLHNIDPEFTHEAVTSSVGRSDHSVLFTATVRQADEAFAGFSYAPPMLMQS